jgi:hypothetical protein
VHFREAAKKLNNVHSVKIILNNEKISDVED